VTTRQLLLEAWIWRPEIALAVATALGVHVARFRLACPARTAALWGSAAALVVALLSPVAALARGTLFSAHMLQHMLLTLVVPPLALLAMPPAAGKADPGAGGSGTAKTAARWPRAAHWAAGVGAMWIWHAPSLCNAAATRDGVRALQSVSLLAMGAAFWWPILGPRLDRRLSEPAAVAYLFTACAACTVLGVAITFSPVEVCSAYGHSVDPLGALPLVRGRWGLTPSVDQQLGGLLMWVPGCAAYAGAILAVVARFYRAPHDGAPEVS
jgi:cytochrome c oxidase assembly factor CtaG